MLNPGQKIIQLDEAVLVREGIKASGKTLAFTNGCFDILHSGHVLSLFSARNEADYLIVAVNSDVSIKRLKGKSRPIINQNDRMLLIASLYFVDYVISFDEDTPEKLIHAISPDYLIKGDEYNESEIIGAEFVKANGGKVIRIPMKKGLSTSFIIKKIKDNF